MKQLDANKKLLLVSAIITITGIILSGPIGILLTQIEPQPVWQGEAIFIANHNYVQTFPYMFGFILILGFTLFMSTSFRLAATGYQKVFRLAANIFTSVYVVLVGLNYAIQISLVPALVYKSPSFAALFTMANPRSVGWILEMFGYGFLGVATILIAPVFRKGLRMKIVRYLLIANGIISILGAAATTLGTMWLMEWPGIVSVVIWNLLILAIMILVIVDIYKTKFAE
ncbi:MAG: hypothetical protein GYA14_17020 [Ignavibacteria bacterium]|nr:hypothetical protein [Ignavibacteria bacterium]